MIALQKRERKRSLNNRVLEWGVWLEELFQFDLSASPRLQQRVDGIVLVDLILRRLYRVQISHNEVTVKGWLAHLQIFLEFAGL